MHRGGRATSPHTSPSTLWVFVAVTVFSLAGTRLAAIAVPWYVLTTTGSPTMTGLVAFAELAPYVVVKALAGPFIDRVGPVRVALVGDATSAAALACVPLLHAAGLLTYPTLVSLVALIGVLRAPGDGAKTTLVPLVALASGSSLERVSGAYGAVDRLAATLGAAFGGVVIALVGGANALWLTAATLGLDLLVLALVLAPRLVGHDLATAMPPDANAAGRTGAAAGAGAPPGTNVPAPGVGSHAGATHADVAGAGADTGATDADTTNAGGTDTGATDAGGRAEGLVAGMGVEAMEGEETAVDAVAERAGSHASLDGSVDDRGGGASPDAPLDVPAPGLTTPAPLDSPGPGAPEATPANRASYLRELAEGWAFLRSDSVLVAIVVMLAFTNMLEQAFGVALVPVWALESGGGPRAIGAVFATSALCSVLGAIVAAGLGERLPRRPVYVVAYLLVGLPRFAILALDVPMPVTIAVLAVGGFAAGFVNPILGAVIVERIPGRLMGRVNTLAMACAWALLPFGGLVGGVLVTNLGLSQALWVVGAMFVVATMTPTLLPRWRFIDRARPAADASPAAGPSRPDTTPDAAQPSGRARNAHAARVGHPHRDAAPHARP